MVGQPKTLYDLRKVEGAVNVTCKACGKARLYDLEELISVRLFHRQSVDWDVVLHEMPCWHCPDRTETRVAIVPYAANDRTLRARRAETLVINLALTVLKQAASRANRDGIDTPAVRLALRVLRQFLPDRALLVRFWEEGQAAKSTATNESHFAHGWIVQALLRGGHSVWAEFRRPGDRV
ncbi:hypothetical protein GCM10022253_24200 [Sphingomonas endophytica]|uniref:Transposase n=1 Tax=Sphingomonas endophytica TaxID=869719 RepID=A0ABR6N2Q5_9SPHN|nr:hypothetical protein [Sphingomonas endophytica]MBB5725068.1 hypothetical protein [Sphingomonas endophytica]